ncbi:MAG: hypothetical protein LBB11_03460 [Puniceicoccales bacterium]|jgi:uncharacterized protein YicC (UPF0701 family)|nr:hypothetical protein [Puniceicoccales bacterium]
MKISFGDVSLARGIEFGETPMDFKVFGQHATQIISTIRGDEVKAIDRGNLTTRIEFRVRKKHKNAEAAQDYMVRHAAELRDLQTDLTIVGEPSHTIYYLKNAVMSSVESSSNTNTSEHFYKILGGAIADALEDVPENS